MTTDWDTLLEKASDAVDVNDLKSRADLVAVCSALGVDLEQDGERWNGLCPFHPDENPSFSVWYDHDAEADRCGCWSCDFNTGDVYDFVQRRKSVDFKHAVAWVNDFVEQNPNKRPEPPSEGPAVDLAAYARNAIQTAQTGNQDVTTQLLADRNSRVPASWLLREFYVGEDAEEVVIPHMSSDGKTVTGIKRRVYPDWRKRSVKGSKLHELYGSWRMEGHDHVVVCEGESDTWTVAYHLRDKDIDVIGLPSGANQWRDEWLLTLKDKIVTLLFDADDAGRAALKNWVSKLGRARIATLREGEDATSTDPEIVYYKIMHAQEIGNEWSPGIMEDPHGGWVRATDSTPPVANFTMELDRVIDLGEDGFVFEVRVRGLPVKITTDDLNSSSTITRWANRLGLSWYGTNRDVQEVLRLLMNQAPFVPQIVGRQVAGWDGDAFVFPEPVGPIGTESAIYVPPIADARIHERILLREGNWSSSIPLVMTNLHRLSVITPIIGWVAAAPLRSIVKKFPILGVTGGSGYGKTTLLQEVLHTFGFGGEPVVLTASTPHAVHALVASTNSVPMWFDEYRAGARHDSKTVLEQVIRDAWDGSSSMKGGLKENRQALTFLPARSPVIVSGEDAFTEVSHIERMALIQLPRDGRDVKALTTLQNIERTGFGFAYLDWLLEQHNMEVLPAPPEKRNRMDQVRAVTRWGWELFEMFCRDAANIELPELDLSLVERAHDQSYNRPVIIEALSEFIGMHDQEGRLIVWIEDDDVCVRTQPFVKGVKQLTDLKLPGGSRAVKDWLEGVYPCSEERGPEGRYTRLVGAREEVVLE